MTRHDARLAPSALLCVIACAAVVNGVTGAVVIACGVALAVLSIAAMVHSRAGRMPRIRCAALTVLTATAIAGAVTVGAVVRVTWAQQAMTASVVLQQSSFTGVVASHPSAGEQDRWTGAPREIFEVWGRIEPGSAPVLMTVAGPAGVVVKGQTVSLSGRVSEGRLAGRNAMWDATVSVSSSEASVGDATVAQVRQAMRQAAAGLPDRTEALTLGMVMGDDGALDHRQEAAMRITGLAHLTAVSGAHFSVVVVAIQAVASRLPLARGVRAATLSIGMFAFVAVVGGEPAVLRALGMGVALCAALAWGRRARALPALCATVIVLLAIDPWLAGSVGFLLSVAAVTAIVMWAPHVAARLERRVVPLLARAIAISWCASIATIPILVPVSGGASAYAVPANVIAGVTAAPVTLAGLCAMVLVVPSAWLATAFLWMATPFVWVVASVADSFSRLPGAWIEWPGGSIGVIAAWVVVAAAIVASTSKRVRGWWWSGALGLLALVAGGTGILRVASSTPMPDWSIVVCDVGQGDMSLVRAGPRSAVVIDTGPDPALASDCLRQHGIDQVPLVILTHPHADHDGGFDGLFDQAQVGHVWISGEVDEYRALGAGIAEPESVRQASEGMEARVGQAHVRVLAPRDDRALSLHGPNDASVVVLAASNGVSLLALGDLEGAGQRQFAHTWGPWVVDAVKVAHHGSADQDDLLASLITARIAVVSAGQGNSYGHPTQHALDLYQERAVAVVRTDECGHVAITRRESLAVATQCPLPMAG